MIKCDNCGGPKKADSDRCEYCGYSFEQEKCDTNGYGEKLLSKFGIGSYRTMYLPKE